MAETGNTNSSVDRPQVLGTSADVSCVAGAASCPMHWRFAKAARVPPVPARHGRGAPPAARGGPRWRPRPHAQVIFHVLLLLSHLCSWRLDYILRGRYDNLTTEYCSMHVRCLLPSTDERAVQLTDACASCFQRALAGGRAALGLRRPVLACGDGAGSGGGRSAGPGLRHSHSRPHCRVFVIT